MTDKSSLDICNEKKIGAYFKRHHPDFVINAAAYTDVELAEVERTTAFQINATGPHTLAVACKRMNIPLLHFSSDYVFDGEKNSPYSEEDQCNPLNYYGLTKLAGEKAIRAELFKHIILRTSWVFSNEKSSFPMKIHNRLASKAELKVVNDQLGRPTSARALAHVVEKLLKKYFESKDHAWGTYNFCQKPTCTWFDFAKAVQNLSDRKGTAIRAVNSNAFPQVATRPKYSALNTKKLEEYLGITEEEIGFWYTDVSILLTGKKS